MPDWIFDFDAPQYLLLLALLPGFWWFSRRSLHALGPWRRRAALFLRMAVAAMMIVALAEPNWVTLIRRLTVLFVVDASNSIQHQELDDALKYVNAAARTRDVQRGDRSGVVVFGRSPAVEVPPTDRDWQLVHIESACDPRFTNLEAALQLAAGTFPPDSARRVVVVSDGNENVGRAMPQATKMLAAGIGFDCVPISYERRGEIAVEKVAVPTEVRRGTPFTVHVVLNNVSERPVHGKLQITRELGGAKQIVSEEPIGLSPGKQVFTVRQELTESGMTTYEARFFPDHPADDAHSENNVATAFCRVSGAGHVLLIEDASQAGRFDRFVDLLRHNDIEVTVRDTRRPFDNLADLQRFDSVILADVARVSGEAPADLIQFSDQQVHELVQNTEHLGCGLVVLGGPNSYGAGGWTNTELEKALPVDCQIESAKVKAVGALMLVIDSSGSMTGEKIAWSKAAAVASSQMLGNRDFIGVVSFDSEPHWIVPIQRNSSKGRTRARIERLGAIGGTDMMPALKQAYQAIQGVDASIKHVIVLTDGRTPHNDYESLVSRMSAKGITTTGVAVGNDADHILLSTIARRGGGKFYQVTNPKVIPRIFMREARRVAMPVIFEDKNGIPIRAASSSELLSGIQGPWPPITGYVLTTVKDNPLVDVLVSTPRQPQPMSTILATWQYGLGRVVALTTDVGQRWATEWPAWNDYQKLMMQTIRWSMRSHSMDERFVLSTDVHDGRLQVIASATDQEEANPKFFNLHCTAILPDGEFRDFPLEQAAPGRFVANLPAEEPGNYYLAVSGAGRSAPLRAAVSVANTAELQRLSSYDGFLAQMAEGAPRGGAPGRLIRAPRGIADTDGLLQTDVFRPGVAPAKGRNSMWPLLLLAMSVVFFADVFCRRVHVSLAWIAPLVARIRSQPPVLSEANVRMERLKTSKSTATARYSATAGAARFDDPLPEGSATPPIPDQPATTNDLSGTADPNAISPSDEAQTAASEFTARLLEAKKRVRENRQPPT